MKGHKIEVNKRELSSKKSFVKNLPNQGTVLRAVFKDIQNGFITKFLKFGFALGCVGIFIPP